MTTMTLEEQAKKLAEEMCNICFDNLSDNYETDYRSPTPKEYGIYKQNTNRKK